MQAFRNYLQQFPNFTSEVFESALPFLYERVFQPDEFFLKEGSTSRSIAFIEKGLFRLYYLNDECKEVTKCFCKENSITTSYKSLITQEASDMVIQAVEESKLIVLPYEALQKLFLKHPFWQQLGRLAAENEYVISETHNRFLSDLSATEKYMQILEHESELLQRVPLIYLASYLQIAPETLSRVRNKISRT